MNRRFFCLLLVLFAFSVLRPAAASSETVLRLGDFVSIEGPGARSFEEKKAGRVVEIAASGSYRLTGTLDGGQIRVSAGADEAVELILDNLSLSAKKAPAIRVESALEPGAPGEAGVTIRLVGENRVTGPANGKPALSSDVSLKIGGAGNLRVESAGEGVETEMHLSFAGGTVEIRAGDDPVNARTEGVSVIRVEEGARLFLSACLGASGDGMDSNGPIEIRGGVVVALANPASADSGLDSHYRIALDGGLLLAAGNELDPVSPESRQGYLSVESEGAGPLSVFDAEGKCVYAANIEGDWKWLLLAGPGLNARELRVSREAAAAGEGFHGLMEIGG